MNGVKGATINPGICIEISLLSDSASMILEPKVTLTDTLEFCASADAAPSAPGAYLLQIDVAEPVLVRMAGKLRAELSSGRYFYCGSANGPGGLKARLARHIGAESHCIGISIS